AGLPAPRRHYAGGADRCGGSDRSGDTGVRRHLAARPDGGPGRRGGADPPPTTPAGADPPVLAAAVSRALPDRHLRLGAVRRLAGLGSRRPVADLAGRRGDRIPDACRRAPDVARGTTRDLGRAQLVTTPVPDASLIESSPGGMAGLHPVQTWMRGQAR